MGWLFMSSLGGHDTPRAYLDNQFNHSTPDRSQRVLAAAVVSMRTYYAAIEVISKGGEREVFAAVCLIQYNPRSTDGHVFGYKDMTEHMGPNESECPASILDLLTPTTHEYAIPWRARCRANIATRQGRSVKPTSRVGQTIIFDPPLQLNDGSSVTTFEVVKSPSDPRRTMFRTPGTHQIWNVAGVKKRGYRLITPTIIPTAPPEKGDAR